MAMFGSSWDEDSDSWDRKIGPMSSWLDDDQYPSPMDDLPRKPLIINIEKIKKINRSTSRIYKSYMKI